MRDGTPSRNISTAVIGEPPAPAVDAKQALLGARVLLIDDDPDQAHILRRFFEGTGVRMEWSGGGTDGLERLAAEGFDLVILDVMMPDLDGWEVFSRLRRLDAHRATPVLFLTCIVPSGEENAASDFPGHCHTLAKPVPRKRLLAAAARLLGAD